MSYDIIESEFNKKFSSAYQLSILVRMDSLVFFVFDAGSNAALRLRTIPFVNQTVNTQDVAKELQAIFDREELFGYLFRRVRISLPAGAAVLVPSRLYNDAQKDTYLSELVISKDSRHSVYYDEISETSAHMVYSVDPEIVKVLRKQFPTAHFYNPATPFILGARKMTGEETEHSLCINFSKKEIQLALFEKQNLLFYNSYSYNTAGDVLYYTLLTLDQFTLDPAKTPVSLSGQILEDAEIYRMLSRYLGELSFVSEPGFLKFGKRFKDVQPYFFFDLYSLALCK